MSRFSALRSCAVFSGAMIVLSAVGSCSTTQGPPADAPVQYVGSVDGSSPAASADMTPVGPTGERHGAPVGWRHDPSGAAAAATGYVAVTGELARLGPIARRDLIRVMATDSYGEVLGASVNAQLDDLLFELGARGADVELFLAEYPLTIDVRPDGPDRATVEVWSVLIVAATTGSVPREHWRTVTLELEWADGDWKVGRWDTAPGPTPAPGPEVQVSPADDVTAIAGRPRATAGGGS